ncbi:semaphorin-4B isoform X2 [Dunckerocampus dactyliophorus]|uniref:semaphorin-4B isoform X2 n=1 Tax=Dunckerocampus dactyliophorus TaxID=161453 RepID=UPI0024061919|nr:semaphorin-4B isoform X2 [Dunckerocampus dactyliophorus]
MILCSHAGSETGRRGGASSCCLSVRTLTIMALMLVLMLAVLRGTAAVVSQLHARSSFHLNSSSRPLVHFSLPELHNITALLLSDDHNVLYVGARDTVLSLDVTQSDIMALRKKVPWRPSDSDIDICQSKGRNVTVDCANFVHNLQHINSTHVYACGSFAFSPRDVFIDADTFAASPPQTAKGRCPFSPFQRSSALAIDGELFTATTADFKGTTPQISRHFSKDGRPDVTQEPSAILLEEPNFVSSAADRGERKVLFFFSEVGKEFNFVDELHVARVARVCQDDVGGARVLQRKWTSLVKTTLICHPPFNVLQDVFTLPPPVGADPAETLFYAIFTSQWSWRSESAVCAFQLAALRAAFTGAYSSFHSNSHQWSPLLGKHSYLGQCGLNATTDAKLEEVKRSFLTRSSVTPVQGGPLLLSSRWRYSRVAAMSVMGVDGRRSDVVFLLTESGLLHKVFLSHRGPRVIEEIQVLAQPQRVRAFLLSPTKGVLYVGSWQAITAVPVVRCSVYTSCSQCLLARDPFCGWSQSRKLCARLEGTNHHRMVQVLEDGSVEAECRGEGSIRSVIDVFVRFNDVVKLPCQKTSNMATLTWSTSEFRVLPMQFFIQSDDGSLNFLASADTLGTYHCQAEEDGYKEVVASYNVIQMAPPRSIRPRPEEEDEVTRGKGDRLEAAGATPPSPSGKDALLCEGRSYCGKMLAVSLVLATCTCFLIVAGFLFWFRRKSGTWQKQPVVVEEDKTIADFLSAEGQEDGMAEPRMELKGPILRDN